MKKYRVLKPYPKHITNSGRLITLKPGKSIYLKKEPQILRLVKMGFLKPVVEMPKKAKKPAKKKQKPKKEEPKIEMSSEPSEESKEKEEDSKSKQEDSSKRKSKSEYLNSKKKNKS